MCPARANDTTPEEPIDRGAVLAGALAASQEISNEVAQRLTGLNISAYRERKFRTRHCHYTIPEGWPYDEYRLERCVCGWFRWNPAPESPTRVG